MKYILKLISVFISVFILVSCSNELSMNNVINGFAIEAPSKTEVMRAFSRANSENLLLLATLETRTGEIVDTFKTVCQSNELVSVELNGKKDLEVCIKIAFSDVEFTDLLWASGQSDYFVLTNKTTDVSVPLVYTDLALSLSTCPVYVVVKNSAELTLENNANISSTESISFSLGNLEYLPEGSETVWYYNYVALETDIDIIEIGDNTNTLPTSRNKIYAKISISDTVIWETEPYYFYVSEN